MVLKSSNSHFRQRSEHLARDFRVVLWTFLLFWGTRRSVGRSPAPAGDVVVYSTYHLDWLAALCWNWCCREVGGKEIWNWISSEMCVASLSTIDMVPAQHKLVLVEGLATTSRENWDLRNSRHLRILSGSKFGLWEMEPSVRHFQMKEYKESTLTSAP